MSNVDLLGNNKGPTRFGKFQIVKLVGKGAIGKVYRGIDTESGTAVAMKIVDLHHLAQEDLEDIQNEVKLLKRVDHPHIVKYIDALRTDFYLCIVLEFVESGSLSQVVSRLVRNKAVDDETKLESGKKAKSKKKKKDKTGKPSKSDSKTKSASAHNSLSRSVGKVHSSSSSGGGGSSGALNSDTLPAMLDTVQQEQLVASYTAQILMALEYIHAQGVIHRDIKAANILLTKNGVVKVADFGVATKGKMDKASRQDIDVVGTPYWMAPEIIEMQAGHTAAVDIWSVGCTVVELLTGRPPYFELQQMPAMFRIVHDEHPPLPHKISPDLRDFLLSCFTKDPSQRPSATDLLSHKWLQTALKRIRSRDFLGQGLLDGVEAKNLESKAEQTTSEQLPLDKNTQQEQQQQQQQHDNTTPTKATEGRRSNRPSRSSSRERSASNNNTPNSSLTSSLNASETKRSNRSSRSSSRERGTSASANTTPNSSLTSGLNSSSTTTQSSSSQSLGSGNNNKAASNEPIEVLVRLLQQEKVKPGTKGKNVSKQRSLGFIEIRKADSLRVLRERIKSELDNVPDSFSFLYNFANPTVRQKSLSSAVVRRGVETSQRVHHVLSGGVIWLCMYSEIRSEPDSSNSKPTSNEENDKANTEKSQDEKKENDDDDDDGDDDDDDDEMSPKVRRIGRSHTFQAQSRRSHSMGLPLTANASASIKKNQTVKDKK